MNRRSFFSALVAVALAPTLSRFAPMKSIYAQPNGQWKALFVNASKPLNPEIGFVILRQHTQNYPEVPFEFPGTLSANTASTFS